MEINHLGDTGRDRRRVLKQIFRK